MVITEEFKEAIVEEINHDAHFGFHLFKAIWRSAGDKIVTQAYLESALASLSVEFDEKLERQAEHFDQKLDQHTTELKRYLDGKLGYIGSRWGEDIEATFQAFAQELVAQWGGTVQKWRRKVRLTDETGRTRETKYEVDLIVTNGKILLIEIKSKCDSDDVERYLENVAAYETYETPQKPIKKAILTFYITAPARELADVHGIRIIEPQ